MCSGASRELPNASLIDPVAGLDDGAAERTYCADGCAPGPGRDCGRRSCILLSLFFCVALLALLFSTPADLWTPPAIEPLSPIVGLPGIFGPDARSFFKRWRGRRAGEEEAPPDPAPVEHSGSEAGAPVKLEEAPANSLQLDDPVLPDSADAAGKTPEEFFWFDDPLLPDGADALPVNQEPDDCSGEAGELPEPPPRSEPLTDAELMRLLGLDDEDDEPSSGTPGYRAFPAEDEPTFAPGEDRPVESLIDDLGSPDADIRRRAVDAIREHGADAVAPLVEALARADDGRRWCVAEALAAIGDDAIPALIAALGDDAVQTGAAATLVRIGEPAVPPLIAALAGDDDEVQFGAFYALREIGDTAIPFLVGALDAPDGGARRSAARLLRELGWEPPDDPGAIRYLIASEAWLDVAEYGGAAVGPLIAILRSPDREARWSAARTLGEIGKTAVGPLVDLLADADDDIRWLAVMALAEIGSPAVGSLIRLLSDPSLCGTATAALLRIGEPAAEECVHALDDADGDALEALQEVLSALGEAAVPPLIQALTASRSRTRGHAAEILDGMGWEPWNDAERAWYLIAREQWIELALMGEAAVVPLIRTLNGDDDHVRSEAAATLGEIGHPAAVLPLVDVLANDAVAPAAADALVAIGRPAVDPVLALLEGGIGTVREHAVEILGRLGAHEAVPAIVDLVRSGGDRLHRKAVDALVGIGAPAVGALIPLLGEDGDGYAGAEAALTGIGDAAREPLIKALGDEDARTRMGAAMVLRRVGRAPAGVEGEAAYLIALQQWPEVVGLGAPAVDLLAARLGDRDAGVRAGAAESLARLGAVAAPHLVSLLGNEARQGAAGETLVRIGEAAVPHLIRALGEEALRRPAAGVLVRIGNPAAGPLVRVLGDPDTGQVAAKILGAMGEPSIGALVGALGDDDIQVRQGAGGILIGLGDAGIGALIGALGHPDDAVRLEAVDMLIRIGRSAVADLTGALLDERYRVRLGAAEALGRIGWAPETEQETIGYLIAKEQWVSVAEFGADAVIPLIRTLNDSDTAVQMGAARALVGIGNPAIEPLIRALRDGSPGIKMGAAATLGKIGNPAAIGPLTDTLLHEDWRVGRVVVRALGMMGEPAVEALLGVLEKGDDAARKGAVAALVLIGEPAKRLLPGALAAGHFRIRAGAADALDRLGWLPGPGEEMALYLIAKERWSDLVRLGPLAVEPLVQVLDDHDDSVRRRAAKALGEVRDPRAVPALMALLHDDFYSIRREAAAALVAVGPPAMGPVISALGDPDGDVRKRAADVLAGIGDARAVEPLRSIERDEDWYVRKAAEEAVEKIRGRIGESV